MIVHHPYRTLGELQSTLNLGQDEMALAWSVINDHYLTDLPLLYPPHVVAVTAILLSLTLKPTQPTPTGISGTVSTAKPLANSVSVSKDTSIADMPTSTVQQEKVEQFISWLAGSEVDMHAMMDCSQEIISLYEIWEQWNEKACKEQIARFVRARGLDK